MPEEITVSFAGPFSWPGTPDTPCVYNADGARKIGIYLWTVSLPDGHLIYYVGETGRSFEIRLRQHYEELVSAGITCTPPQSLPVVKRSPCGRAVGT